MNARTPDPDPYWQEDELLGDIALAGATRGLRLKLHHSEERFSEHREIVPLRERRSALLGIGYYLVYSAPAYVLP